MTLRQGPKDPVLPTLVKMPYYKRKNNRVTKRRRKEKKEIERNKSWKKSLVIRYMEVSVR